MEPRSGLRVELLASLGLVMLTATGLLGAVLVKTYEATVGRLHQLAAQAMLEDVRSELPNTSTALPEMRWWVVEPDGGVRPRGYHDLPLDAGSRTLAEASRSKRKSLLRAGAPWEPIRFAAPIEAGQGAVAVAYLPAAVPRQLVLALLLGDVFVFTALGAYLLRRRVVLPLERLSSAARAIAEGEAGVRAPVEGARETAEVGAAFNEMTDALESRSEELEKAVLDLRESNRSLREAQDGLDRAARLAAVGRLASGVAHEVGNPMGAMLAFLDLARRDPGISEESRHHLVRAGQEGQRVRGILRQLLDFSRPPCTERVALDVAKVCEETAELVRAQRRYANIVIDVAADADAPQALGDRNILLQIVLNLLLNAGDALRDAGTVEPRVSIRVRPGVLHTRTGEDASAARQRRRFDAVECEVADNGPGIAAEDRERIFDPFFTTKAPGDGTGLGLANAVRFAEELGGGLTLEDTGQGATFILRLPTPPEIGRGARTRSRA